MFAQTALNSLDSYKLGHPDQYPAGTRQVVSNFTPRNIIDWCGHGGVGIVHHNNYNTIKTLELILAA